VTLDLGDEPDRDVARARRVLSVARVDADHDLALLRLAPADPHPPPLALGACAPGDRVAAIGYPSGGLAHYDPAEVVRLFGDRLDIKRLAPGTITAVHGDRIDHDCTTLGGSSGSPLVDLATGAVVGVHYGGAGRFLTNWAAPSRALALGLAGLGVCPTI
jgi:glutamyl endopeptidase